MDPRLTASNGRVALEVLRGQVQADRFVAGELRQVGQPVAPLWKDRSGFARQRELIFGERFTVLEEIDGRAFGQSEKDGQVGYLDAGALCRPTTATHMVSARSTHLYRDGDLKAPAMMALSFGSRLRIVGFAGRFARTDTGEFVPEQHISLLSETASDPVTVAELFLGVPYLWGGNSIWGLDCSGLVQVALNGCGVECPGDSDLQEAALGSAVAIEASVRRGDLFFWKGHVAMAVDAERLIHANANDMAVACEPIKDAVNRIAAQGEGPVTSRKRL